MNKNAIIITTVGLVIGTAEALLYYNLGKSSGGKFGSWVGKCTIVGEGVIVGVIVAVGVMLGVNVTVAVDVGKGVSVGGNNPS